MDIADPYTAFCFDEACAVIVTHLKKGDDPVFVEDKSPTQETYSSFSKMYESMNLVSREGVPLG